MPTPSDRAVELHARLRTFIQDHVIPGESAYRAYRAERDHDDHSVPPVVEELKTAAREQGLWNLFLPAESGLSQLEYATLAELTGWSLELAPEATNCAAPDTGNMELLHLLGTEQQQTQWLEPLLAGDPLGLRDDRAGRRLFRRDNIETRIVRDGDEYVVSGRKWWISGAADLRCKVFVVMGKTDPDAETHRQQSMVIVPADTPGIDIVRVAAGLRPPAPAVVTARSSSTTCGCRWRTSSARRVAASRLPRPASARVASIT